RIGWGCWEAKPRASQVSDAEHVLELLWLLLTAVVVWARQRQGLGLENLLLRHQLAVLTRPARTRGVLVCVSATSCSGSRHVGSMLAGASTWRSSRLTR